MFLHEATLERSNKQRVSAEEVDGAEHESSPSLGTERGQRERRGVQRNPQTRLRRPLRPLAAAGEGEVFLFSPKNNIAKHMMRHPACK